MFIASWGTFGPTLEDMMNLTTLPLGGETKAISMAVGQEDEDKLQQLTSTIVLSKVSGKFTYASSIMYFDWDE